MDNGPVLKVCNTQPILTAELWSIHGGHVSRVSIDISADTWLPVSSTISGDSGSFDIGTDMSTDTQ